MSIGISELPYESKDNSFTYAWAVRAGSADAKAPVAKTGQTLCYDGAGSTVNCAGTGQDGELQEGMAWPDPRFTTNGDGTVTDNLTGLIWLQNANCLGQINAFAALTDSNGLKDGQCGLTDNSAAGDWRLPNRNELASLIDHGRSSPALPASHPFTGVQSADYWSSTANNGTSFCVINMTNGESVTNHPLNTRYIWPVRGGQ